MKPEVKERVYLLVIVFSMFMCGAMIITMLSGAKPVDAEEHIPVVRDIIQTEADDNLSVQNDHTDDAGTNEQVAKDSDIVSVVDGQIGITEEYLNNKLEDILPSGFPLENTSVDIDVNGVTVKGDIKRDDLANYLKKGDKYDKYSLILLLLPDVFDIEAVFMIEKGNSENNGAVISSDGISISGKKIDHESIPFEFTDIISGAVNKIIKECGDIYRFSGLEDGILLLEKI